MKSSYTETKLNLIINPVERSKGTTNRTNRTNEIDNIERNQNHENPRRNDVDDFFFAEALL